MNAKKMLSLCALLLSVLLLLSGCIVINPPKDASAEASEAPAETAGEQTAVPETPQTPEPVATATPTPLATPEPIATAVPEPAETPSPSGVTEKKLGYVTKTYADGGTNYIVIDYIEMYMGQEAIQKALEDKSDAVYLDNGVYTIDNDYYIRNNNTLLRTFPVSADCRFKIIDTGDNVSDSIPYKSVDFKGFSAAVKQWAPVKLLMHVSLENGVLVYAEEQFLP